MRTATLCLVICGALAVACSAGPDPLTPGPERAPITLDSVQIRAIAQILRLEDQRRFDAAIFRRLGDGSEEVRRRAAVAAGRIGDPAAVEFLIRLLSDDPSPAVLADAAFAIGVLGDTSRVVLDALRDAVPAGWVPVRGPDAAVVGEVVHALGKLGTDHARKLVLDALRAAHPGDSELARRIAAEALLSVWRFSEGPGRVNAVVRYADVGDQALRWRAAYALMRLGDSDGAPTLLTLLADTDHRARASAARGLRPALADSAGIRDTALVALTAALQDAHPHVRINAVRTLAAYGDDAPIDALVARLDDPDSHVVFAAAEAMVAFSERVEDVLIRTMTDPARPYPVRAAAAASVAGIAADTVQATLLAWAHGDSPFEARYAAARVIPALPDDYGEPHRQAAAGDPDRRVAVAGHSSELARLGDPHEPPTPAVDHVPLEDRTPAFYEEMVRTYVVPALAGTRPRATIRTAGGEIVLELLAEEAPLTVHNFVTLARAGYWDHGVWHRVIPNFVLQDGAPAGDPNGGPGWSIRDEINRVRYTRGALGMALSGPDTGGSQWFITHSPQHHLDGGYTIFGRVVDGMDVADAVLQGDPIEAISVSR